MKNSLLRLMLIVLCLLPTAAATQAHAQATPASQMEKLDRGLIAVPNGGSVFLSWRMLGTDDELATTFTILRNGVPLYGATDAYKTNATDPNGTATTSYQVVTLVNGVPTDTTAAVTPWDKVYLHIPLQKPADGVNAVGEAYNYTPNDCSVGDVDGDGQYEIILKWDPSNAKDNSQSGYTGNVLLDCYKLDGTLLWRIDLGKNIRAGAHYTQFLVYDFDGDGRAELMCKTAPGSLDGKGKYVNQVADEAEIRNASNSKSWLVSGGRVNGGQEYLTVFNGLTGEAIHTVYYNPNRNTTLGGEAAGTFNWGGSNKNDAGSYGNRGERYLAAVAYLDGADQRPSGVFSRGYYTYAYVWAVDFDGQKITTKWLHRSDSNTKYSVVDGQGNKTEYTAPQSTRKSGSRTMYGNGNHNLSVADVDGDGRDEIIWGSAALNSDGTLLYATGFGHGDAIHLAAHCPDREGLQVFQIHEESPYGWDLHDAATGEVLLSATGSGDNGRGMAGAFDASVRGSLFWSSNDGNARSAVTGNAVSSKSGSSNFRLYWDGDLQDDLLDGNTIDKWNGNGTSRLATLYNLGPGSTCNGTKKTPNLCADILGDWRDEVILWDSSDSAHLAIYTTTIATNYRVPTPMHDHTYRMGIAWQNVAYNQPPHLGYYLPDAMWPCVLGDTELTVEQGDSILIDYPMQRVKTATHIYSAAPDGTTKTGRTPIAGFTRSTTNNRLKLSGKAELLGDYTFHFRLQGLGNESDTARYTVHCIASTPVRMAMADTAPQAEVRSAGGALQLLIHSIPAEPVKACVYDAAGRLLLSRTFTTQGLHTLKTGLNEGVVFVRVRTSQGTLNQKVVLR